MRREEASVRVCVCLDLLQAQLMKQLLLDNGIECMADRDMDRGMIPAGEFGEIGLWVSKQDEARARALLEEQEEEMSAANELEIPEKDSHSQG